MFTIRYSCQFEDGYSKKSGLGKKEKDANYKLNAINNTEIQMLKVMPGIKYSVNKKNKQVANIEWPFLYHLFPVWCILVNKSKKTLFDTLYKETNQRFSINSIFKLHFWYEKNHKGTIKIGDTIFHANNTLKTDIISHHQSLYTKKSLQHW